MCLCSTYYSVLFNGRKGFNLCSKCVFALRTVVFYSMAGKVCIPPENPNLAPWCVYVCVCVNWPKPDTMIHIAPLEGQDGRVSVTVNKFVNLEPPCSQRLSVGGL